MKVLRAVGALGGAVLVASAALAVAASPTSAQDQITTANLSAHLNETLPELNTSYGSRSSYIRRLVQAAVDACLDAGAGTCSSTSQTGASPLQAEWLDADLPMGNATEDQVATWAQETIQRWHHEALYKSLPDPLPARYYVYQPAVVPQDADPSPRTPPAVPSARPLAATAEEEPNGNLPASAPLEWQRGGLSDGTLTTDDQYLITPAGYYRRKLHSDGTWYCYFNGNDGSLANLGAC